MLFLDFCKTDKFESAENVKTAERHHFNDIYYREFFAKSISLFSRKHINKSHLPMTGKILYLLLFGIYFTNDSDTEIMNEPDNNVTDLKSKTGKG